MTARLVAVDDGTRLRTWTSGSGGALPAVVLLHGGPGLWDYLAPIARMLEPLTLVHRFDQRGCGGSDPSGAQSVARSVADVEALRRHWGHDSWVVLGHSFGATLALEYAVAHPGRTAAMGYLDGVGVGDWRAAYHRERSRRMTEDQQRRLAALEARPGRSRDEEVDYRALSWFTDHADPVRGWELALERARTDHEINTEANRLLDAETSGWSTDEVLTRAGTLTVPCWFVHGTGDPRPAGAVADLAAAVPGAELHLLEGAGHEPWCEQPESFGELLGRLLTSLAG